MTPLAGVGRSTDNPSVLSAGPGSSLAPPVSPIPADFATRLSRVGPESFLATGHAGGRYTATLYVSTISKDAVVAAKEAPVGTQIVLATVDRASKKPGPSFFMEKDASKAWRFGVVESPEAKSEELVLCARCHAEAPHDGVFALPE